MKVYGILDYDVEIRKIICSILAPQMLSAWKDTATNRRTTLGLLDPATTDPADHARAVTATGPDFEHLAKRYRALHATADPTMLLTPVAAHVRMVTAALGREDTAATGHACLQAGNHAAAPAALTVLAWHKNHLNNGLLEGIDSLAQAAEAPLGATAAKPT